MSSNPSEFERLASQRGGTLLGDVAAFLMENKKWWLLPILLVVGALGLLTLFAPTGAAPFIYTLF